MRKYNELTKEEKETILKLYNEQISVRNIESVIHRGRIIIKKFLKEEFGVLKRRNVIKESEKNEVLKLHDLYHSTYDIVNITGLAQQTISHIIKSNGKKINRNKYKFNENYFEKIDVPNKAYFLGLLYADGSVHPPKNSCKITLTEKDKYILNTFREEVQTTKPLSYGKSGPIKNTKYIGKAKYSLELISKKLISDLNLLGMMRNKSQIIRFPSEEQVPNNFLWDFIRGWFDGDGCIYNTNNKIMLNFVSNELFLKEFTKFLYNNLGIKVNYHKDKSSNSWYLFISKIKDVLLFCENIYKDKNCIKLDRKYEKYMNYLKRLKEVENILKNKQLL